MGLSWGRGEDHSRGAPKGAPRGGMQIVGGILRCVWAGGEPGLGQLPGGGSAVAWVSFSDCGYPVGTFED